MDSYQIFFVGMFGALVIYYALYRNTRIIKVIENPRDNWRVLTFDLLLYIICGGLVTLFYLSPDSIEKAFLGGASWQGVIGSLVKGAESKREGEYKK